MSEREREFELKDDEIEEYQFVYNNISKQLAVNNVDTTDDYFFKKQRILQALQILKRLENKINSIQLHDIQRYQGLIIEGYHILGVLHEIKEGSKK